MSEKIKITEEELKRLSLTSVSDRPNAAASYGTAKLSAQETKALFDRQFRLLAERLNMLSDEAVMADELPESLPNPQPLIINGIEYDGSVEVKVEAAGGGGVDFEAGAGLLFVDDPESNKQILKVDTADDAEEDNTRPITSAAVYAEIGNIDAILRTI